MQNIQDLNEKIFSESKNIIDILSKTNNVEELISKHDLLNELAEKIAFLKLLDKNLKHYAPENAAQNDFNQSIIHHSNELVTEEEAIFNNELNEIGSSYEEAEDAIQPQEEEAIFNNQLNEIIESDFHESLVNIAAEEHPEENLNFISDEISDHFELEEEAVFNNQLNGIDETETSEITDQVLSFVDEERILADAERESDEDYEEEQSEELNSSDNQMNETEEKKEQIVTSESIQQQFHTIPDIFEDELTEEEMLIGETENQFESTDFNHNQEEIITENSNVEAIITEIKKDSEPEEEDSRKREIVDIEKPEAETKESPKSDESFENIEAYHQEKKIKLANIRGLKSIRTLFDDDPLERETPHEKVEIPVVKKDTGSLIKTNIPTDFMEAEKQRPEFRLDLNDRLAFTKILFEGSQTDLNNAISELNRCRNLDEAKEYLSDLYYEKKWEKVDEYAQRLWLLVENKFM